MAEPAIVAENLTKVFKGDLGRKKVTALDGLNLEVPRGEVFAFLGPNGAGKTTTIKLLTRLLFPTAGTIRILGEGMSSPVLRHIGFLPEQPRLYEYLTAQEFLDLAGRLCGLDKTARKKRIEELLETAGLGDPGKAIRHFSRGMMQRLGLAQALMHDPDVLILDEPMESLDPVGRKDFRDLILNLKRKGKTVFFSSHILSDAEMLADRVGILIGGRLVRTGKLGEMLSAEEETEIAFIPDPQKKMPRGIGEAVIQDSCVMIRVHGAEETASWIDTIRKSNGRVVSVIPRRRNLESYFLDEMRR